ncbi:ABC transporter substrate-binding protein [Plantactinospora soyae]|uniref:NitT/TauT family transport system substrate-binding protein n=1 Tax=Plantactinospora soyae TaxID=1544732 RepID=A0A927MDQ7_9ACTN|nr:ABC transporter substrate-binding protein [Plantactinospora soyae]MBE1491877.1 NitT/TauT family transport system substrate-binding protein [Plantactinospora soyae]
MFRRSRVLAAALLATALTVSGCSSGDDSGASTQETDKVAYITAFGAVGRDAFAWVAKEKGYFAEVGIEVDIKKGAGNGPNLTALKAGQVQFASLDFTGAVIQAGKGEFTDWRAIAAVHQQTLISVMTTKDTNISSVQDLAGKTMATGQGSVTELLFPAYAQLAGLDPKSVTIKGVQPTALNSLMTSGQVDALGTFLLSRGALATASKKEVVVLPYSDYLRDLFGNAIITTPALIEKDPDLVRRFNTAVLKGLQYSIDNPEEAAKILNKAEPSYAVAAGVGEITAMTPYVKPAGGAPIGFMDEQRVARTIAILQGSGLMPAGLDPKGVVDFGFVPKS